MATNEEIETLLQKLKKAPPSECFQNFDMNTVGIRAILKMLSETDEKVTAGKISEKMNVSTARVAVLLKKMVAKGLIEKENDEADGRVVLVKLSESGKQAANDLKKDMYTKIGNVIDKIGMERMLEFAAISKEIHSVISASNKEFDI